MPSLLPLRRTRNSSEERTRKKKEKKYTTNDALKCIVEFGLSTAEALKMTDNVCSRQYLNRMVLKWEEKNGQQLSNTKSSLNGQFPRLSQKPPTVMLDNVSTESNVSPLGTNDSPIGLAMTTGDDMSEQQPAVDLTTDTTTGDDVLFTGSASTTTTTIDSGRTTTTIDSACTTTRDSTRTTTAATDTARTTTTDTATKTTEDNSHLTTRVRRSSREMNRKRIEKKVAKAQLKQRSDAALKEGMELWTYAREIEVMKRENNNYVEEMVQKNPNFIRPMTIRQIVAHVTEKHMLPGDKPISKTTLHRFCSAGGLVENRKRQGPPNKVPMALLNTMRLHMKVQQVSKKGQISGAKVRSMLSAAVEGTKNPTFNSNWAFERLLDEFPEDVNPVIANQQEAIRNTWTTWSNINKWFNLNKRTLLESGLAIDEPMTLPDGTVAEISMDADTLRRIINFDETEHTLSTVIDRGGSRALRWGDKSLPLGTERSTRGNRHTTGIYAADAGGEILPPVYCFDSGAGNKENFQVKFAWVDGLPTVRGRYGCPTTETWQSSVSVRKSGCTDEELLQQIIVDVYLPLYPNLSPVTKRDANGKFLRGPIIIKTDSGQGRLSATLQSVEFRERLRSLGVYIVLGLPNSTSCTQEMDQLYQDFKGKCQAQTFRVFNRKLAERSRRITEIKEELKRLGKNAQSEDVIDVIVVDNDDDDDGNDDEEAPLPNWSDTNNNSRSDGRSDDNDGEEASLSTEQKQQKIKRLMGELKELMKNPCLKNEDLPMIVNGFPGDPFHKRPFASTFTPEKIVNCFERVGYAPFTRKCLESKYVRHELGEEHGASEELEKLVEDYERAKEDLRRDGFNVDGIFNAEIDTATTRRRQEKEDEQVKALVSRRAAFSASAIFQNIGTMCITDRAVIRAQKQQLLEFERKKNEQARKKNREQENRLVSAQEAREKKLRGETLTAKEFKAVIMFVLPASGSNDAPSQFSTKKKIEERLSKLDKQWWEYIPQRAATGATNEPSPETSQVLPAQTTENTAEEDPLTSAHLLLALADATETVCNDVAVPPVEL